MQRDLEGARKAYKSKDEDLSRQAHILNPAKQEEGHKPNGELIKSIVFGGLDGILTTFALVSGAAGANMSTSVILILGFAGAFADGLSMGLGDALSEKAEAEHVIQERNREFWEYDHYQEGEIAEMIELYVSKGMTKSDAETIVHLMAPHRAFFVDLMTIEELGLNLPDMDSNPWKDGFVTFASFVVFGTVPLLGFCVFPFLFPHISSHSLFVIACMLTVCTLALLGAVKSMFSSKTAFRSALEMVSVGSLIAILAYFIGEATNEWVGIEPPIL